MSKSDYPKAPSAIIATAYNTGHNRADIWIEHEDGFNYMFEGAWFKWNEDQPIEDFANELLFEVGGWSNPDNGLRFALPPVHPLEEDRIHKAKEAAMGERDDSLFQSFKLKF